MDAESTSDGALHACYYLPGFNVGLSSFPAFGKKGQPQVDPGKFDKAWFLPHIPSQGGLQGDTSIHEL
ncbi:hypothetical protein NEUTE1DRAFT_138181 [Neurospora tetrasperma FGSC 2508]|uniref:Uncharacterized protein n=1 Tax=Neurospora tetrasperma (strain FGSC 2508 / ATCC MYA-4615 / P0657) TaxID=510951 RepID=F8MLN5_NEUT8|nr:uncharacterized protein NEUTE1DRAFT_138181 [Neurospora tetrasperma FGSC 2508]EGO58454.1 hypothetical protein NEUTE1DRAFT_138181 [Neurospora tetrasperma FGSC 2508]